MRTSRNDLCACGREKRRESRMCRECRRVEGYRRGIIDTPEEAALALEQYWPIWMVRKTAAA